MLGELARLFELEARDARIAAQRQRDLGRPAAARFLRAEAARLEETAASIQGMR